MNFIFETKSILKEFIDLNHERVYGYKLSERELNGKTGIYWNDLRCNNQIGNFISDKEIYECYTWREKR